MKEKIPNVYQNIEESIYSYRYLNYEFYFSSQFYKRNFKLRLDQYIKQETYKLKNRYKTLNEEFIESLQEVLLIALYKQIEKRGFRVYKNNERYIEKWQV